MLDAMTRECERYFGWPGEVDVIMADTTDADNLLRLVEILVDYGQRTWNNSMYARPQRPSDNVRGIPNAEAEVNALFERHRFGYRLTNGEAHKVGSPLLGDVIVGPTLTAIRRPG
jgi:hypothetical protein